MATEAGLKIKYGEGSLFTLSIECHSDEAQRLRKAASTAIAEAHRAFMSETQHDYREGPKRPCGCPDK